MAAKEPLLLYTHPDTGELLRRRWQLEVIDGNDFGTIVDITYAPALIGAAPAAMLVITDETVSRYHAEVDAFANGIRVRDLDSTNGTFVDDVKIRDAFVEAGHEFRVGRTTVRTRATDEPAAPEIDTDPSGVAIGDVEFVKDALAVAGSTRDLLRSVRKIAPSSSSVLFEGERGSGRATLAKLLHDLSPRKSGPFVTFNPRLMQESAEPEALMTSVFERARNGTLFIEEIEHLPEAVHVPLLRAIESGEIQRPGDERKVRIDVRTVASTSRALKNDPRFHAGLYRRIAVVRLKVPALRDRPEDITPLAELFFQEGAPKKRVLGARTKIALTALEWPGNGDELREAIARLDGIESLGLPDRSALQVAFVADALAEKRGHVTQAALDLGMTPKALFRFLKTTYIDLDVM
jgi:transcriptional regulator with GAF, ATPase, and Fis domain